MNRQKYATFSQLQLNFIWGHTSKSPMLNLHFKTVVFWPVDMQVYNNVVSGYIGSYEQSPMQCVHEV